jgi:hypothetical protein
MPGLLGAREPTCTSVRKGTRVVPTRCSTGNITSERGKAMRIKVTDIHSTAVKELTYEADNWLVIKYTNGRSYRYENVEQDTFAELIIAESFGKFVNQRIKNNENYEWSEVTED